jgi:hypothetical protein
MNTSETLLYFSNKAYGKETSFKIASVITKESANLIHEELRLEDYPGIDISLREKNIDIAIGDILAMTQLYCSKKGKNYNELYMLGCQRAIERCKEKLEGRTGF